MILTSSSNALPASRWLDSFINPMYMRGIGPASLRNESEIANCKLKGESMRERSGLPGRRAASAIGDAAGCRIGKESGIIGDLMKGSAAHVPERALGLVSIPGHPHGREGIQRDSHRFDRLSPSAQAAY